jgi:hypothetical protein
VRAFIVPLVLASSSAAAQECPLSTNEPGIVASLSSTRSGVELQKDGATQCVISLDCEVRAGELKGIDYELATLVAPKVTPKFHQVSRVTFRFADGSAQTCAATTVSKP